jgi:hypothetical protein
VNSAHDLTDAVDERVTDRPRRRLPWEAWSPQRRRWAALGTAAALVLVGAVAATLSLWGGNTGTGSGPIALPDQVGSLPAMTRDTDPTQVAAWRAKAEAAAPGASLAARTYGTTGGRTIRIVAARTSLSGKLEQAWAADDGAAVGDDRCTQNVQFTPKGPVGVRHTVALCWRSSSALSAYALLIDPKSTVRPADAAAALDQSWAAITTG